MNRFELALVVLSSIALPALVAAPVFAEAHVCSGERPESVLRCYARAYAHRDSAALALLLARDYVAVESSGAKQKRLDYGDALRTAGRLFGSPKVAWIEVQFGKPQAVRAAQEPETWILRHVPVRVHVQGAGAGRLLSREVHKLLTLWVRLEADPQPHYVIFREERRDPGRE